jgi:hypothetical protein
MTRVLENNGVEFIEYALRLTKKTPFTANNASVAF